MGRPICLFLLIFVGCVSSRETTTNKYIVEEGVLTTVLPSNDYELGTELDGTQELSITQRNSTGQIDVSSKYEVGKENEGEEGGTIQYSEEIPTEGYEANTEYTQIQEDVLEDNALWVKSGNRGNLKCLKVNNHFALIFQKKKSFLF